MTLLRIPVQSLLLIILLAAAAMAQSPADTVELKTPDGRTVILKRDGTWEYKKEIAAPSPNQVASASVAAPEALPQNFSGDDPPTLLRQLVDLKRRLVKSEFETSAAYETRAAAEKKKPIIGDRDAEATFYLLSSAVTGEYNADTQMMIFALPVKRNVMAEVMRGSMGLEDRATATDLQRVSLYSIPLGSYEWPKVFFNDPNGLPLAGDRYDQQFSARVNLNVDDARRLKTNSKALLTVKFEEPFAIAGESFLNAGQFQVRLLDVQFFDPQTGRILAKLGSTSATIPTVTASSKKNLHLEKAQELYDARRDTEALVELRRVLADEPTNAEAYLLTGRINLQRDDQEAAIAALKTAVFWDAKLVDAHILLARIFLARRDNSQANKYVDAALALDATNKEALALRRQIPR